MNEIIDTTCVEVKEPNVVLGDLIEVRVRPAGSHAWYESNVGPVRKPIQ